MKRQPLIVQLFNGRGNSPNLKLDPESVPDHTRAKSVLEESGFEVETIATHDKPWNPAANMHNAFRGLDPLRALRVLLTRRDAALVCAHLESAFVILLLRRLFRFRPPVVIWEVPWSPGWAFREKIARFAIPRAACSVVFSSTQLALVRQVYGKTVPVDLILFSVDTDFYRPQPPTGREKPYVLSCGLDAGRDFNILLESSQSVNAPFKIKAGKGLTIDSEAFPNVTLHTEFLSYVDFRKLYVDASIVVVATHNTPNACGVTSLMEAMAMGKPTIVSDNPALRDYLPPPDAGVVVPVGDSAALRAAIIDLLEHPDKAAAMGLRARAFAEQKFHPQVHFRAMADLFGNVMASAEKNGTSYFGD